MMKAVNVLIVGGGVAGVAAASRLISRGIDDLLVVEAEGRLGGRVWTKPFGKNYVDLGAHWVHGQKGNVAYEMVQDTGLVEMSGDFENIHFVTSDGTQIKAEVGMELYQKWSVIVQDHEAREKVKGSLYEYVRPKFEEAAAPLVDNDVVKEAFFDWLHRFECSIEGSDTLKHVSAPGLSRYRECEGDLLFCWSQGGYSSIIDVLLNRHPVCSEGEPINLEEKTLFNCKVNEIDWSGEEAIVKCQNGDIYKANRVIVTTSIGVLKDNHKDMFNPPLPPIKINAIKNLGFGVVDKIYLKFPSQWWPEDCSGFSLLHTQDTSTGEEFEWEKDFIGFYSEASAPLVLCGWLIGEGARQMEQCTQPQILKACTRVLKKFLGKIYEIPEPEAMLRSQWFSNPNFRGSYSYHSTDADKMNACAEDLSHPLYNYSGKEVLLFAGEATHPHFYSTVHGAIETGWREADRIIVSSAKEKKCSL